MTQALTTTATVNFRRKRHGRKALTTERAPRPEPGPRVPRISRLMALAIRLDGLIRSGEVTDQAALARLGMVTRARMTQIMNLLNLAPDIQEQLLLLPAVAKGRELVTERSLRPIVAELDWRVQRRLWQRLCEVVV